MNRKGTFCMSNIVKISNESQLSGFSDDQLRLIKSTVAKGATDDELKLFLYRCKNLELDPLKPGQIYFIKYNSNSAGTIVVGIDGFRSRAARTGKLAGIKRGSIKEDGKLVGAWAEVYRSDWQHPAREEVPLAEYNSGKSQWQKMPETMIKKVAECAALRMAFPDELGGIYAPEEMDQATPQQTQSARAAQAVSEFAQDAINDFFDTYNRIKTDLGADCYKKYLVNKEGNSPTLEQIKNWKSDAQIKWLQTATDSLRLDFESKAVKVNELPDFDDADFDHTTGELVSKSRKD